MVLGCSLRHVLPYKNIYSLYIYYMTLFQIVVSFWVYIVTFVSQQNGEKSISSWGIFPGSLPSPITFLPFFNGIWKLGWIFSFLNLFPPFYVVS